jgi:hypothetical protein
MHFSQLGTSSKNSAVAEIWLLHLRPFALLCYRGISNHQVLHHWPKVHSFLLHRPFFLSFLFFFLSPSPSSSSSHLVLPVLSLLLLLLTKIRVNYLTRLLNLCQDVTNISACWGILVNNNCKSVE